MQESPFYNIIIERGMQRGMQRGIERGIERGKRENAIQSILSVLTVRFPDSDVQPVSAALESISDIERLSMLLPIAVNISDVGAFLREVKSSDGL